MDPVVGGARGGSFPDELVELASLEDGKPITEFLRIGVVDVTGFAGHVLAGRTASDGSVELGTAVAGADDHGLVHLLTEGL